MNRHPADGCYLRLFHGRTPIDAQLDDWGTEGPTFGPFDYFHTTYASEVKFGDGFVLSIHDDLLYYDGVWYGDWSVFHGKGQHVGGLVEYDEKKARMPVVSSQVTRR